MTNRGAGLHLLIAGGVAAALIMSGCSSEPGSKSTAPLGLTEPASEAATAPESDLAEVSTSDSPGPEIVDESSEEADAPPIETSQVRPPQVTTRVVGNCLILKVANVTTVRCPGATMQGADLRGFNLSGANLRNANLSGTNLAGMSIASADLSGADLSGAQLDGTRFPGTNLSGATWTDGRVCATPSAPGRCE
jgi:hypothetical protein